MESTPAEAFQRHVVPEMDLLLRVANSITRRPVDAEDLVQDTLLRAYRGIGSFDGAHPRAWLLKIMQNARLNSTRRRRPELMRDPEATLARPARAQDGERETPEAVIVDASTDPLVRRALAELPPRFLRVVELVDVGGLSYPETASVLGIPVGTVMSRLHRARSRLKLVLGEAGVGPTGASAARPAG
ncbi:MAG: RNA polymerase sigma factor [Acidimicrobiales bacterium]